jgi:hypothetical protein
MHSMHTLRLIRISIDRHGRALFITERHTPFDRIGERDEKAHPSPCERARLVRIAVHGIAMGERDRIETRPGRETRPLIG